MVAEKKLHLKYQWQRIEAKHNEVDTKGLAEQAQMQKQTELRYSIGTFNIFKPQPNTEVSSFTLGLSKAMTKPELYKMLAEAFDGYWNGEPTRSIYIHLDKSMPLAELQSRLRDKFKNVLGS